MDDKQFRKIRISWPLIGANIIKNNQKECEYILNFLAFKENYTPSRENYQIIKKMFRICDNNEEIFANRYNKTLIEIINYDLKKLNKYDIDETVNVNRLKECRTKTIELLVSRGINIEDLDSFITDYSKGECDESGLSEAEKLYVKLYKKTQVLLKKSAKNKGDEPLDVKKAAFKAYQRYKNGIFRGRRWSPNSCRRYYYNGQKIAKN